MRLLCAKRLNGSRFCSGWRPLEMQGTLCKTRDPIPYGDGREMGRIFAHCEVLEFSDSFAQGHHGIGTLLAFDAAFAKLLWPLADFVAAIVASARLHTIANRWTAAAFSTLLCLSNSTLVFYDSVQCAAVMADRWQTWINRHHDRFSLQSKLTASAD